jgi:acetoin utilization deacetylase AcuC-like enzyme
MANLLQVYTHPDCLAHDPGPGHPEAAFRLAAVLAEVQALALVTQQAPLAERTSLARAHAPELLDALFAAKETTTALRIDADTVLGPGSLNAALRAAGAGVAAVKDVLSARAQRVFCAVRPPGHHATRDHAMGFCLLNSIAVAAYAALDAGLERVSIVDFDVHHGNGTQDIFWHQPRVQYLSSHQAPLYPGTGSAQEQGAHGNIVNVGLPALASSAQFRAAYQTTLLPALAKFAPQLILISAGFDAHALDPLASLNLLEDDYAWLTDQLCLQATRSAEGRIVSMLEGGYSETALKLCTRAHLHALNSSQRDAS